uniref:POU domain protein n=1 Tax=Strix occidentalis caurina TaxID=311401 RepID=A0A8D0KZF1_STROC
MIALKPILQAWLEEAEGAQREKMNKPELFNGGEKKRKRTSIAAPEKRSLEAYFAVQPRPSSEKIAAIAEKLDLKKNVVRVWFCNQRQKQKRMKFSLKENKQTEKLLCSPFVSLPSPAWFAFPSMSKDRSLPLQRCVWRPMPNPPEQGCSPKQYVQIH